MRGDGVRRDACSRLIAATVPRRPGRTPARTRCRSRRIPARPWPEVLTALAIGPLRREDHHDNATARPPRDLSQATVKRTAIASRLCLNPVLRCARESATLCQPAAARTRNPHQPRPAGRRSCQLPRLHAPGRTARGRDRPVPVDGHTHRRRRAGNPSELAGAPPGSSAPISAASATATSCRFTTLPRTGPIPSSSVRLAHSSACAPARTRARG
jgi:hypothetical protein